MRKLGLALLVAGVTASPVSAGVAGDFDWTWSWLGACGGSNYETCMSGSIAYSGTGNILVVMVENGSPYAGDIFTSVGLFNLPAGLTPAITVDGALSNWGINNYNGINGDLPTEQYATTTNGVGDGFGEDGVMYEFTFSFAGYSPEQMLALRDVVGVGIHAQSGPAGCSTKMGVVHVGNEVGAAYDNVNADSYAECVSVPEPGSMALLATGLAGMAFMARRRRSGAELVDENGDDVEL